MSIESGFDDLQGEANADKAAVDEARRRRDVFSSALGGLGDVTEVFPSGSLARGTHKDPIHDVDMVVVFDAAAHPDWHAVATNDPSAEAALEYTRSQINTLLGSSGSYSQDVRHTLLRNHSVKCFLDDPDQEGAFTVDVTPALERVEGGHWIPEKLSTKWVASDPKFLMKVVAARHAAWPQFAKLVRVLKRWNTDHGGHMKSLTVEILALHNLPVADRPNALARFFAAAAVAVHDPICDPANLCGEIQPDLDRTSAAAKLTAAAELAWRAVDLAANNKSAQAMCTWRQLFGDIYPEPPGGCDGGGGAAAVGIAAQPKRPIKDTPQG